MASTRKDYDCQRCGACCYNPDENRVTGYVDYIEVRPADALWKRPRLFRRLAVFNEQGEAHMKLNRDQRCVALRGRLGRAVECSIYADRPRGCRRVEPGTESCLKARRERGVDHADT
jgi:Fe-S-cluster containining protein